MDEKRQFMRFNVILDAMCRRNGKTKKLQINNFSKEGLGILARERFDEGEDVDIELMIPGDNIPIICEGEVAWSQGPDMDSAQHKTGIRFKNISGGDKGRILEYIYQNWIVPSK